MSDWSTLGFPAPQVSGYGYDRDVGILRTPFDTPTPRLKQGWKDKRETYKVWFLVNATQLADTEAFFSDAALDWFTMPLINGDAEGVADYTVRAAGPCTFTPLGMDWWKAQFTVETQIAPAAPDLGDHGFSTAEETCCLADDIQCCESEAPTVDCTEFTEIRNIPPYETVAVGQATLSLPNIGGVLALFASSSATNYSGGISTDGGVTWESVAVPLSTTKKYLDDPGDYTQVGNLGAIWGRNNTTDETWIAFTEDGETWAEYKLHQVSPTVAPVIETVVHAASLGEYWIFGSNSASTKPVAQRHYVDAWKTSDDPMSGTATWTHILYDASMTWTNDVWTYYYPSYNACWSEELGLFFLAIQSDDDYSVQGDYFFHDTGIFTSPDGINWTGKPLPNGWGTRDATPVACGNKVLLISMISATNGVIDTPSEGWWVFGTTDGTNWTRVGQLPEPFITDLGWSYYHTDRYEQEAVYNPTNGGVMLASASDAWVGSFVYSADGGATWYHKNARFDVDGYPDTWNVTDRVMGYAYIPDTTRFALVADRESYTAEVDPYTPLIVFDAACITEDPPREY